MNQKNKMGKVDKIEKYYDSHHRKTSYTFYFFIIFLLIIFLFLYFAFFRGSGFKGITGYASKNITAENAIQIQTDLKAPEHLKIKSNIETAEIKIKGPNEFNVGNQQFELNRFQTATIIMDNFNGEISFNEKEVLGLNGRTEKVSVNGVPVTSKSNSNIKVSFSEPYEYSYIKLNNFYMNSLSYNTSGKVILDNGKININLESENFQIKDFQGNLETSKNKLKLTGYAMKSNIQGLLDISSK